jgi:hypothetical protein
MKASLDQARAAKEKVAAQYAPLEEVNGVGITRVGQGFGVKVNLAKPLPDDVDIPDELDGVKVVTETIGPIHPL